MFTIWLWVDDKREAPEGWVWIKSAKKAKLFISVFLSRITHISLDHDLGDDEDGTGYDIAKYIEELAHEGVIKTPISLKVHSDNGPGRKNIQFVIDNLRKWGLLKENA